MASAFKLDTCSSSASIWPISALFSALYHSEEELGCSDPGGCGLGLGLGSSVRQVEVGVPVMEPAADGQVGARSLYDGNSSGNVRALEGTAFCGSAIAKSQGNRRKVKQRGIFHYLKSMCDVPTEPCRLRMADLAASGVWAVPSVPPGDPDVAAPDNEGTASEAKAAAEWLRLLGVEAVPFAAGAWLRSCRSECMADVQLVTGPWGVPPPAAVTESALLEPTSSAAATLPMLASAWSKSLTWLLRRALISVWMERIWDRMLLYPAELLVLSRRGEALENGRAAGATLLGVPVGGRGEVPGDALLLAPALSRWLSACSCATCCCSFSVCSRRWPTSSLSSLSVGEAGSKKGHEPLAGLCIAAPCTLLR